MNLRILSFLLSSSLALVACGKTSDIPALQNEVAGVAQSHKERLEELEKRGNEVAAQLKGMPQSSPGFPDANAKLASAGSRFRELRNVVNMVGAEIQKAGTPEAARALSDRLAPRGALKDIQLADQAIELQRVMDLLDKRIEDDYPDIVADLGAVESWLAIAATRPRDSIDSQPPPPPSEPATGGVDPAGIEPAAGVAVPAEPPSTAPPAPAPVR